MEIVDNFACPHCEEDYDTYIKEDLLKEYLQGLEHAEELVCDNCQKVFSVAVEYFPTYYIKKGAINEK